MFRFALSLLVGLLFSGRASAQFLKDLQAQAQAKIKAQIEASKIPAVSLTEKQIATLKAIAPNDQVVWHRAGRQSDGKTFVCLVTHGKNRVSIFGETHTELSAGTFESDGSFQRSAAHMISPYSVRNECRRHGFDPPVSITGGVALP
jgi:hypothetical protein